MSPSIVVKHVYKIDNPQGRERKVKKIIIESLKRKQYEKYDLRDGTGMRNRT